MSGNSAQRQCFRMIRMTRTFVSEVALSALHCFPKVGLVHNVVAVKDGSRFVAANGHCYALRDASPDHVPYSRPAEVMENASYIS